MSFGRFQFRRDTSANWSAANPVLAAGEVGLDLSTKNIKIGDGTTAWSSLPYLEGAISNGDKGDITVSSGGAVWTIDNGAVSLAKMANVTTGTVFYRKSAGTGAPEVQTLATLKTDLGLSGTNTGDQTITLTGDVTGSGTGSFAATLGAGAVTLSKMANLAANSILGNNTGLSATPAALTPAQVRTLINVADGATANTGTVTSVSGAGTVSGLTLTGTVTTSGSLTLGGTLAVTPANFASQTANTVLAAPNGSAGAPTFRSLVAADIPTLNQNTTGSAATLTTGRTIGMTGDVSWTSASFDGSANVTGTSTIGSGAVTNAKLANVATSTIKGRITASTGSPEDLTPAQVRTIINVADGATANTGTVTSVAGTGTVSGLTLSGAVTTSGSLTLGGTLAVTPSDFASQTANTFLAAPNGVSGTPTFRVITAADIPTLNQNTTGSAASLTTARNIAMTGDVTWTVSFDGSANVSAAGTIAAGSVTNAKLANVATGTFKGRTSAGSGSPEDLTGTQATALLDTFSASLKGLVPASGGGTTNFLRADGTWAAVSGGSGTVTSVAVSGGTTGLTTSGGPITTSGTITLGGTLAVSNGGTGAGTLATNNVLLGNGTSALQTVAPGASGNILTSDGTTWTSASPSAYVTLTGVQTLTNKTIDAGSFTNGYTEEVYALVGTDINPINGSIQTKTLGANTVLTESISDGQSVVLMLNPSTFTTTWPTVSWVSPAGTPSTPPTLKASVVNVIVLWQVGGTLYGMWAGSV